MNKLRLLVLIVFCVLISCNNDEMSAEDIPTRCDTETTIPEVTISNVQIFPTDDETGQGYRLTALVTNNTEEVVRGELEIVYARNGTNVTVNGAGCSNMQPNSTCEIDYFTYDTRFGIDQNAYIRCSFYDLDDD